MKKIKIGDLFLIALILFLTLFIALFNFNKGGNVIIEADGKIIKTLVLSEDSQFVYDGEFRNVITVKDGKVYVSDSNCPDKTCINSGKMNRIGYVICCLPNRLVIRIAGTTKNVDVISG